MSTDDSHTDDLGRLFVEITGAAGIREAQQPDTHGSGDPDALDGYKEGHDSIARHEALSDALEAPEIQK